MHNNPAKSKNLFILFNQIYVKKLFLKNSRINIILIFSNKEKLMQI